MSLSLNLGHQFLMSTDKQNEAHRLARESSRRPRKIEHAHTRFSRIIYSKITLGASTQARKSESSERDTISKPYELALI